MAKVAGVNAIARATTAALNTRWLFLIGCYLLRRNQPLLSLPEAAYQQTI
jgi:hypothetical protein